MKTARIWAIFFSVFVLVLSFPQISMCAASEFDKDREDIIDAFELAIEAQRAGGNITETIQKLNEAIDLLHQDKNYEARQLAQEAENEAVLARDAAVEFQQSQGSWLIFWAVCSASLLLFSVLIIWMFRRSLSKIVDESWAFVLTTILIVGAFAYTESIFMNRTFAPFSEFSLLGPAMNLYGYPTQVKVDERFRLFVYVANHMGEPTYYVVKAKYSEANSTIVPSLGIEIQAHERILLNNESYFFPFDVSLEKEGSWRLIFELWEYNASSGTIEYSSPYWLQLWINVTSG